MADPRRGRSIPAKPYPRTARVNETVRHAVASELERLSDADERLSLLTVTGVECDPDLRRARVYLASLDAQSEEALEEERGRMQAAIARRLRSKRVPHLLFEVDPAVVHGEAVEAALRSIGRIGDASRDESDDARAAGRVADRDDVRGDGWEDDGGVPV